MVKISFVNLYTKNLTDLVEFYRDTLGLETLPDNKDNWFGFDTGEATFALEPVSNRKDLEISNSRVLVQFDVDSMNELERLTKRLEDKNVVIVQRVAKRSYGTVTTFIDPDGNVIELMLRSS